MQEKFSVCLYVCIQIRKSSTNIYVRYTCKTLLLKEKKLRIENTEVNPWRFRRELCPLLRGENSDASGSPLHLLSPRGGCHRFLVLTGNLGRGKGFSSWKASGQCGEQQIEKRIEGHGCHRHKLPRGKNAAPSPALRNSQFRSLGVVPQDCQKIHKCETNI